MKCLRVEGGSLAMDQHPIREGVASVLFALCNRNWGELAVQTSPPFLVSKRIMWCSDRSLASSGLLKIACVCWAQN